MCSVGSHHRPSCYLGELSACKDTARGLSRLASEFQPEPPGKTALLQVPVLWPPGCGALQQSNRVLRLPFLISGWALGQQGFLLSEEQLRAVPGQERPTNGACQAGGRWVFSRLIAQSQKAVRCCVIFQIGTLFFSEALFRHLINRMNHRPHEVCRALFVCVVFVFCYGLFPLPLASPYSPAIHLN